MMGLLASRQPHILARETEIFDGRRPSAAAIMSSIGSACSAASTSGSRARVAGCFGVKSVQQS